jgi:tRNA U34 5-carboxymethylaminomethyl modifying GTPase MnmE/TrmE
MEEMAHSLTEEIKSQIAAVKLEIDYELTTLHEALEEQDKASIKKCKEKLKALCESLDELTEMTNY